MLVVIKGAGDIASGIALRLYHARFAIVMTEIALPTAIRRTVCFSDAISHGSAVVEGVRAVCAHTAAEAGKLSLAGQIAVLVDPAGACIGPIGPGAVIDAILAKRNTGTTIHDAPIVIGIGPGFETGVDCHAVIETQRGHTLGRVITEGGALPNTGEPGDISGYTAERVLRAPVDGVFRGVARISDKLHADDVVGMVGGEPVRSAVSGVLRGLLSDGIAVTKGYKCGDVDPRADSSHCFTVSDKALSVGGGVLEALLRFAPGHTLELREER
ncbi:MAG: EF2563 family selenium-dependent molybdenum hydroxylase system protein [Clostridiales bacterium]|jgi:xanthine dehydrogenase accessory factor|nr:EF2563 family selenium-dependent molybdenum hydroxylase system protein [Clostridiales bacterium]